jgi:hypothetical protein
MPRDPAAVALAMIAAEPDETPPSGDELTALAQAHLDTIRAQSVQGGNKVTIQLDVHRYSAAEALAKAQQQTLRQLLAEALDLAIARGSTR